MCCSLVEGVSDAIRLTKRAEHGSVAATFHLTGVTTGWADADGVHQISPGIDSKRPLVLFHLRVSIFSPVSDLCMLVPRISVSIQ
jgi:hypothetical protein